MISTLYDNLYNLWHHRHYSHSITCIIAARHARSWPCALSVPSARLSPGAAPRETGRLRGGRAGARAPSSSSASERAGACSGGGLQWLIETRCKITTTFLVTYCNDLPRFGLRFYWDTGETKGQRPLIDGSWQARGAWVPFQPGFPLACLGLPVPARLASSGLPPLLGEPPPRPPPPLRNQQA